MNYFRLVGRELAHGCQDAFVECIVPRTSWGSVAIQFAHRAQLESASAPYILVP